MRVLLLGATGMLGSDLAAIAPAEIDLHPTSHDRLDVTDPMAVAAALDAVAPDIVVNATGYTSVDNAEADSERAFAVNAIAVEQLGRECVRRRISVVHFSSDYVFDGSAARPYREEDATAPLNVYGKSKLSGERALLSSAASALVIRTQWLFGVRGKSFPRTMWERARRGERTRVVDDQRGRPTFSGDLARATWRLIEQGAVGLFHVAASGDATRYDVASRVFARAGASELLHRCQTADLARPARRPMYSVLDTVRAEDALGYALPPWEDGLARFLESMDRRP